MDAVWQMIIVAVAAVPFFSAFLIIVLQKKLGERAYKLSIYSAYLSVAAAAAEMMLFYLGDAEMPGAFTQTLFALHPTPVGVVLSFFVALVSVVIHRFSVKYMYDDPGYLRYFILLDLMIGDIFLLLLCGNILMLAATWHMMGILLYFLLVHNFQKAQTVRYGFYTFFTHLLADIPLMFVVWIVYHHFQTTDIELFLSAAAEGQRTVASGFGITVGVSDLVALLLVLSAMIKSTQFPFHLWLPFTLEGPTPVSALMHAGIVNAGAFLVNRFAPVFAHADFALHVALVAGLVTAIIGSTQMLIQQDIKKALAYSTMGQMGYMMLEIGAGAFALAVYHMMVHGLFKASLFLGSGGVIHDARLKENIADTSLFDFYFSTPKGKAPSRTEYLLFVLILPALISMLLFAPLIEAHGFKGVMVFYFFAWVSAAQVVYTIYHQAPVKRLRAVLSGTVGYALAIWFYVYAEKAINLTLYPDERVLDQIIHSAVWPDIFMHAGAALGLLLIFAGAFVMYRRLLHKETLFTIFGGLHDSLYRLFSREFYIQDFSESAAKKIVALSKRINDTMRY